MEISAGLGTLHKWDPTLQSVTYFSNSPLDRQSEMRKNAKYMQDCLVSDRANFILCCNQMPLTSEKPNSELEKTLDKGSYHLKKSIALAKLNIFEIKKLIPTFGKDFEKPLTIYLGCSRSKDGSETHWFAVDVTDMEVDDVLGNEFPANAFRNPRPNLLMMDNEDAAIAAHARSILSWHARYSFCPSCGSATSVQDAGYKRWCTNEQCKSRKGVHNTCFPRLDPVVIMLIMSPDKSKLLLGRKEVFVENFYSCLAGFMEPGETVEEAVRREVYEESRVLVGKVSYKFSQPWPFPSVLMIGCFGQAISEEITVCDEELEDVRWFDKCVVQESVINLSSSGDPPLMVPPGQTIAHQLMKRWLEENDIGGLQSRI